VRDRVFFDRESGLLLSRGNALERGGVDGMAAAEGQTIAAMITFY
jgi:hypothetical protein